MAFQRLQLYWMYIKFLVPRAFEVLADHCRQVFHRLTYRLTTDPKNVVVLGGSFGGFELTRKLAHSLPTGYRVVMVERNSAFHYTFNFPRYCVLQKREHLAFIPYDGISRGAPAGIYRHVQASAVKVTKDAVQIDSGEEIPYAALVVATGTTQTPPAKMLARQTSDACLELQGFQYAIQDAASIAVVGGGAVGVELATDIKSFYPEKNVTLVHSGARLLPRWGPKLHEEVMLTMEALDITVRLNQRPRMPHNGSGEEKFKPGTLTFSDGSVVDYDLVIPCTGQRPNSEILADLAPDAISTSTGRILVRPTLQVSGASDNIFAIGDVAETGAPKMARAAWFQCDTVHQNLMALIRGRTPSVEYVPNFESEGALKLTVGRADWMMYAQRGNGEEVLSKGNTGNDDLDIVRAWGHYGARIDDR